MGVRQIEHIGVRFDPRSANEPKKPGKNDAAVLLLQKLRSISALMTGGTPHHPSGIIDASRSTAISTQRTKIGHPHAIGPVMKECA